MNGSRQFGRRTWLTILRALRSERHMLSLYRETIIVSVLLAGIILVPTAGVASMLLFAHQFDWWKEISTDQFLRGGLCLSGALFCVPIGIMILLRTLAPILLSILVWFYPPCESENNQQNQSEQKDPIKASKQLPSWKTVAKHAAFAFVAAPIVIMPLLLPFILDRSTLTCIPELVRSLFAMGSILLLFASAIGSLWLRDRFLLRHKKDIPRDDSPQQ